MISKVKVQFCIVIAAFILLTSGCTCNSFYNDRPEDVSEAKQITENFYALLTFDQYKQCYGLMSDRFFKSMNVDTSKFVALLKDFDMKLGKVDSFHLEKCQTSIVTGTNPSATYVVIYSVHRGKHTAEETFNLEKENGKVKISGYHIRSDGFLNSNK